MVRYQLCQRAQNKIRCAPIAQLVEHLTLNQGVQGSNPCWCTIEKQIPFGICFSMLIIKNRGENPKGRDCETSQSSELASKERSKQAERVCAGRQACGSKTAKPLWVHYEKIRVSGIPKIRGASQSGRDGRCLTWRQPVPVQGAYRPWSSRCCNVP